MTDLANKIYEQAIDLPIDDRLMLIDKLLINTNLSTPSDINLAWEHEIERRCQEIDSGTTTLNPRRRS